MPHLPVGDERGSLPLTMLVVLVVASLVTVLTATVISGQRHTSFDQNFEQSLQIAEIGLDRMTALIQAGAKTSDFTLPATTADAGQYSGSAALDPATGAWTVTATGVGGDGTARTVQARVSARSVFDVAAFGRAGVTLNGANGVDSYRSGTFSSIDPPAFQDNPGGSRVCGEVMCSPTGNGTVGTNGALTLRGVVFDDTDWVEIHYAKERIPADQILPGATGYCQGANTTCGNPNEIECGLRSGAYKLQFCAEPIELPDVELPSAPTGSFDGNGTLEAGTTYVFSNATLTQNTVVNGTPEQPTIVFLSGQLTIPNNTKVNMQVVGGEEVPKPSPGLLIFSASQGVAMDFGNHSALSAALYAPRGAFTGGAQGHLFGSLVANNLSNVGGWRFHYDDALGSVTTGSPLAARDWVELR